VPTVSSSRAEAMAQFGYRLVSASSVARCSARSILERVPAQILHGSKSGNRGIAPSVEFVHGQECDDLVDAPRHTVA